MLVREYDVCTPFGGSGVLLKLTVGVLGNICNALVSEQLRVDCNCEELLSACDAIGFIDRLERANVGMNPEFRSVEYPMAPSELSSMNSSPSSDSSSSSAESMSSSLSSTGASFELFRCVNSTLIDCGCTLRLMGVILGMGERADAALWIDVEVALLPLAGKGYVVIDLLDGECGGELNEPFEFEYSSSVLGLTNAEDGLVMQLPYELAPTSRFERFSVVFDASGAIALSAAKAPLNGLDGANDDCEMANELEPDMQKPVEGEFGDKDCDVSDVIGSKVFSSFSNMCSDDPVLTQRTRSAG